MTDLFITLSVSEYFSAQYLFELFYNHASYLFVFVFMLVESTFVPFPSEVVVPPAAYLAFKEDRMEVSLVILAATAGAIAGALINYYLSMWLGRPIIYKFANSRVGHFFLLNKEKVERSEKYFDKHGSVSTFIGRLIPVVRQLISIPAGLSKMNIWKFILYTGLGALLWNVVLGAVGYILSLSVEPDQLFSAIEQYNGYLTIGGLSILGICVLYMVYKAISAKKES